MVPPHAGMAGAECGLSEAEAVCAAVGIALLEVELARLALVATRAVDILLAEALGSILHKNFKYHFQTLWLIQFIFNEQVLVVVPDCKCLLWSL